MTIPSMPTQWNKKTPVARCSAPRRLLLWAASFAALALPSACALASASLVQRGLNALTAVSTVAPAQRTSACAEVRAAKVALEEALPSEPVLESLHSRLGRADAVFCSVQENDVNTDPAVQTNPLVWQSQPECTDSPRQVYRCSYNHDRGRGMFIYERPTPPVLEHFLVCAQSAGESSGLFSSGYSITSRCVVSSVDWFAYVRLDPQIRIRSDVRGVLRWESGRAKTRPIQLPRFLAEQCATAFSEAIFCSPTLMVLPTTNPNVVDVCGLHSSRQALGLQFIHISSVSSQWQCTRTDLRVQTPEPNTLSVKESECIPDSSGEVDASCDLPYLPRDQTIVRVKQDDRD